MSPPLVIRVSIILALLLLVIGCRTGAPGRPINRDLSTRSSWDVLGAAEIGLAKVNDAHDAIMHLRPEYLRGRAAPGFGPTGAAPVVYLNGVRQGETDILRTIPVGVVLEVRYLTPAEGSDQFGPYHPGGVIAVRTRK